MANRFNLVRYYHETACADILRKTMPYYQIGYEKMAQQLGISTLQTLKLLSHKHCLTTNLARRIENRSGLSADLLLKLDADYQRNPS